jgi:hypothetical protein
LLPTTSPSYTSLGESTPKRKGGLSRREEDKIRRPRPSASAATGKPGTEGFEKISALRGPFDPATVIYPPSFDTHYRSAYLIEMAGMG